MKRTSSRLALRMLIAAIATLIFWGSTGCDDTGYYYGGDVYVDPMDLSPYGYDYDMYDIFTEDL